MTQSSRTKSIIPVAAAFLIGVAANGVSADRGAPVRRSERPPVTALDEVQADEGDDPIAQVPDAQMLERDAAAERRRARLEARRAAARARQRAPARDGPRQEATPSSRSPRPASHMPPAMEPTELDRAFTDTISPRDRASLPAARAPAIEVEPGGPPVTVPAWDAHRMAESAAAAVAGAVPEASHHVIQLLDEALTEPVPPAAQAAIVPPEPAGPPTGAPTREDVQRAFANVVDTVRACVHTESGRVVTAHATFLADGRMASVEVDVGSAPIPPRERSCMARALRDARISPFEIDRFEVDYALSL